MAPFTVELKEFEGLHGNVGGYREAVLTTGRPTAGYVGRARVCVVEGKALRVLVQVPTGQVGPTCGTSPVVLGTVEVMAAANSFSRLRHLALLF